MRLIKNIIGKWLFSDELEELEERRREVDRYLKMTSEEFNKYLQALSRNYSTQEIKMMPDAHCPNSRAYILPYHAMDTMMCEVELGFDRFTQIDGKYEWRLK